MPSPHLTTFLILAAPFALAYLEKKNVQKALKELSLIPLPKISSTLVSALKTFAVFFVALWVEAIIFHVAGFSEADKVREIVSKQSVYALAFAVTLVPVGEELLFRGYLQTRVGVTLSSVLFSFLHLGYGSVTETIAAFTYSVIVGLEFRRTGNVYACVLSHALFNALALVTMTIA